MKSKIKTFFITIVAACSALCLTQTTFAGFGKTSEIIQNNEVQICFLTKELDELKKNEQSLPENIEEQILKLEQTIYLLHTKNDIIKCLQRIDHEIENIKLQNKNETIKANINNMESDLTYLINFMDPTYPSYHCSSHKIGSTPTCPFSCRFSHNIDSTPTYTSPCRFYNGINSIKSTNNNLKKNIENETKIDEENKKNFLQHIETIFKNIENIKDICSEYSEIFDQYIKNIEQTENINNIKDDEKQTENISKIKDDKKQNQKTEYKKLINDNFV